MGNEYIARLRVLGQMLLMALLLASGAIGCTKNNLYFPPKLPPEEVATLRGKGGVRIYTIDGLELETGPTILGMTGSNEIAAFPGERKIELQRALGNGYERYRMILDLEKGSVYEFQSANWGRRIVINNATAGRRWELDYQTLTAFDPAGTAQPLDKPISP